MKYENFESAKSICERIVELERKRSEISGAETLNICNLNGYPALKIPIGKSYEIHPYQSYAYQFRDSVLSDIDKQIESLKNKLEKL